MRSSRWTMRKNGLLPSRQARASNTCWSKASGSSGPRPSAGCERIPARLAAITSHRSSKSVSIATGGEAASMPSSDSGSRISTTSPVATDLDWTRRAPPFRHTWPSAMMRRAARRLKSVDAARKMSRRSPSRSGITSRRVLARVSSFTFLALRPWSPAALGYAPRSEWP